MTTRELIVATGAYLVALVAVAYFARVTARRLAGALGWPGPTPRMMQLDH